MGHLLSRGRKTLSDTGASLAVGPLGRLDPRLRILAAAGFALVAVALSDLVALGFALALALEPKLVVADEPVTALDVIIQRQILDQLRSLQREMGLSVIMVTHDISVVAYICDRTVVMYAGKVVEDCDTATLLNEPLHPYTMGLKNAFPDLHSAGTGTLTPIAGSPQDLANPPAGCRFAARCPFAIDQCRVEEPALSEEAPGHSVACHRAEEAPVLREQAKQPDTWGTAA